MGKKFDSSDLMERVDRAAVSPRQVLPEKLDIETITEEILTLKQSAGDAILKIGHRLIEAKNLLQHGEWLQWLNEKVEFSERTAQNFMRLALEWSNPQALADLGATKALTLLALPPEEREVFMAENHVVNGEEKTVIDMTTRELEQTIRERDEARKAAEEAKANAQSAEDSRAKMEADMAFLKMQYDASKSAAASANEQLAAVRAELEELKNKPMDVAVMSVDQKKLDQARAEAVAEMQDKVDKARKARDKAEEKRKAAEAALADVNAKLEAAAKAEKKAAITSDRDLAEFGFLLRQADEIVNKLHGIRIKVRGREDPSAAENLARALLALSEKLKEAAQ